VSVKSQFVAWCEPAAIVDAATRVAIATAYLLVHGCKPVDGGAVELSWKLRPASGIPNPDDNRFLDCDPPQIELADGEFQQGGRVTEIRLDWSVHDENDPALIIATGQSQWDCDDNHGVTGFDLPEGIAELHVSPVCLNGDAAPDTYTAPAPVEREVKVGHTISLGAVELILQLSGCPLTPCICLF
jgi:hypothetical protein